MLCKPIQTKLAVHEDLTAEESRHAQDCADCADFAAFDADLGSRLAGWRDPGSVSLRRPTPARRYRLAVASLAVAALTFGVLALPTRSTATTAYTRMLSRVRRVDSVHLVVRWRPGDGRVEDGPMRKVYELWWRPGAWRESNGSRTTLKREEANGLMFYRLDPMTGQIAKYRELAPQPDFHSFDLLAFAGGYMDAPTRIEQPSPTQVVTTNAGGWSRMVFTLDPSTGLPTHADKQSRDPRGAWTTAGEIDLEFDGAFPESRFSPEDLRPAPAG